MSPLAWYLIGGLLVAIGGWKFSGSIGGTSRVAYGWLAIFLAGLLLIGVSWWSM